jgi:ABC-type polysaccharide/polyol phosphate export permease
VWELIGLVSTLAIYFYIVRYTHAHAPGSSVDFFTYILPGLALVRFVFGLGRTLEAMDREQSSGTLELLLSAPHYSWAIVAAASLYELLRSVAMAIVALAVGRWIFGARLTLGPSAWASLSVGLLGAATFFLALTLLACGFLIAFKRGLSLVGLIGAVVPFISGMYFSISILPSALQHLARLFPLTLAVDVTRAGVVYGKFPVGKSLVMLAATFACLPLAAIAADAAVRYAQRMGTLGHD